MTIPARRISLLPLLLAVASVSCRPRGEPDMTIDYEGGQALSDTVAATPGDSVGPVVGDSLPADTASVDTIPAVEPLPELAGAGVLALEIRGSLYETLVEACPDGDPEVLSAHIVRCLWWDVDPWRDICAGDSIHVVFRDSGAGLENRTVALRFRPVPGSTVQPFALYLFRRSGDSYPSYWHPDGTEAVRLPNSMPVSTFEEITGIFGEPRGDHQHGGLDFKAPEGTPVRTIHGGVVIRADWNTTYNGRCLEIGMGAGYSEVFLHLQGIADGLSPGASVAAGSLVGWVGNTGRSYSAHLHYQINDENGYPIDPLVFYGSHRRTLSGTDMERFAVLRAACDSLMAGS